MIDGLKPYPAMKDSGVPWLGEVPEHWEVKRGKALFGCIDVRSSTGDEELLTVSSERGVVPRSSATVTMFKADSYIGYKLCWPGDLVINSLWAWGRGLGVSQHHGIVSSAYGVYRLRPRFAEYAAYIHQLVRSTPFNWELQVRSKGIWISRLQLTDEAFLGAPFPLPPPDEQAAIVRFLDHADRRIRRYIRAKQKLIKLLEEQKQAIIHRAVTRGLDPNVRLKPSGVEWLGDVPEHWEVVRNKTVCRLGTGHTPSRKVAEYWVDCTVPWFTLGDVHQIRGDRVKYVLHTKEKVSELGLANSAAVKLAPGTVILSRTASVGWSAILGCEMATSQDFMAWTPGPRVSSEFLLAVLRAMRPEFSRLMYGSTHNTIYMPVLHNFRMPLPSLYEQARIVAHVDDATAKIAAARESTEREIALLREYRTRLIADVVTGKLDVREAAARLPDEVEEPEPLGEIEAEGEPGEAGADDTDEVPEEAEA